MQDLRRALQHADPRLSKYDPLPRIFCFDDFDEGLQGWTPLAQGARGVPVLILSPAGMQLRLRQGLKRPEHMERFLDLALDLGRLIGP